MKIFLVISMLSLPVQGVEILVDYRFDDNGFFNDPMARAVVEAAAARWSRVVNQSLLPVNLQDEPLFDARFEIIHPATGQRHVLSAAAGPSSDVYVQFFQPPANEYLNGFTLAENVWVLFVGGRALNQELALGGPIGGGGNFSTVYTDGGSFINRGFNSGVASLPVLGGVVSFDIDRNWNFNLSTPSAPGMIDFYTVALHEIGHGLGLNSRAAAEWENLLIADSFVGIEAVTAYNAESGLSATSLQIENASSQDYHWKSNFYTSRIFPFGVPLLFGTVGANEFQALLMEPAFAVVGGPSRLEITNVDLAALRDLGWSTIIEEPPSLPELPLSVGRSPLGGLSIQLISEVGATYTIQTSPDGVSWVNVMPAIDGDGNPISWEDGQEGFCDPYGPGAALAGKYYRVIKN